MQRNLKNSKNFHILLYFLLLFAVVYSFANIDATVSTISKTSLRRNGSMLVTIGSETISTICTQFGCNCISDEIICDRIPGGRIGNLDFINIFKIFPDPIKIQFTDCFEENLDFYIFSKLPSTIRLIRINRCGIQTFDNMNESGNTIERIVHFDLQYNEIKDFQNEIVCKLLAKAKSLRIINLSHNLLKSIGWNGTCVGDADTMRDIANTVDLRLLNVSHNKIDSISDSIFPISILDLSFNEFKAISISWPASLTSLDLSNNRNLQVIDALSARNLQKLSLVNIGLKFLPPVNAPELQYLSIGGSEIETLNFERINANNLKVIEIVSNRKLSIIRGQLPYNTNVFKLSHSAVQYLPNNFFERSKRLRQIDIKNNAWDHHHCLSKWIKSLPSVKLQNSVNFTSDDNGASESNCTLGISQANTTKIIRAKFNEYAILPCNAYGTSLTSVEWWLLKPNRFIGSYHYERNIDLAWSSGNSYRIIEGGYLVIEEARRDVVERYRCVAANSYTNISMVILFRLDYSDWYRFDLTYSVYWGSILASIILCSATLVLNMLWILSRYIGLRCIKRYERNSRVRSMVEALEKYRQRQMSSLHEAYQKKIDHIRENYNLQLDQLRSSYANQQKRRLREYGLRRIEQLWDSYERQINRIRAFSLQQRLRLMRTYKVKQRYLNSLFDKFAASDVNTLTMNKLQHPIFEENEKHMNRSPSYYSLPDYLMKDGHNEVAVRIDPSAFSTYEYSSAMTDNPCSSLQAESNEQRKRLETTSEANLQKFSSLPRQCWHPRGGDGGSESLLKAPIAR